LPESIETVKGLDDFLEMIKSSEIIDLTLSIQLYLIKKVKGFFSSIKNSGIFLIVVFFFVEQVSDDDGWGLLFCYQPAESSINIGGCIIMTGNLMMKFSFI
jgi:hypothetical protein